MKILIYKRNSLINSSGGAEKAMCALAGHFAEAGHDVLFLTRDTREGNTFYPLHERVKLVRHNRPFNKLRHLFGKTLKKTGLGDAFPYFDRDLFIALQNRKVVDSFSPDVIVATSPADAVELLYGQTGMPPVIVTLHSGPGYFFKNKRKTELYKKILKRIAAVQVLQPSFVETLKPYYDGRIEVIGNCIGQSDAPSDGTAKRIVYPARIEPDKQQYELTRAFCRIAKDFPEWKVDLYGDIVFPDYRDKCVETAKAAGAGDQIVFHGITTDVPKALAESSICAFPSKFEGFGMGLAEALAAGLPAVGFASASGVNELIKDGENGFLAVDTDDFAKKLKRLMSDADLRRKMGEKARQSTACFAPDVVWKKWDGLVRETVEAASLKDIPVYIISFNRLSYLERLVDWLEKAGCANIHIVDNASTYAPLLDYLAKTKHTVHRLEKNYGHRVLFEAPEFTEVVDNRYFILSDPDILPVEECPADFMRFLYGVLERFPDITKAGFGMKIDDLPDHYELKQAVVKWEKAFYEKPVKGTSPAVYKAPIDTTFALYRPRKEWKKGFSEAVRTGFPYQARHLPWYKNLRELSEEDKFYNGLDAGSGNWNGTKNADSFQVTEKSYIKLFGVLPVVKIKKKKNKKTFFLFCFLPVFRKKEKK